MQVLKAHFGDGSSPLTRGKRVIIVVAVGYGRLIPAHAGKTRGCLGVRGRGRAHPRSRGENNQRPVLHLPCRGSSPLTRGKRIGNHHLNARAGLIPAHAGKTRLHYTSGTMYRAHPRSRGENLVTTGSYDGNLGSSPLTRGKPFRGCRCYYARGLIPAHAGKTTRTCARFPPPWAHPRSRGENMASALQTWGDEGSSPLTRGKRRLLISHRKRLGLIPAHAGKTRAATVSVIHWRAHPRSRGENTYQACVGRAFAGSSPLTRGKPPLTALSPKTTRLIPAHAGKTGTWPSPGRRTWAHPRSRGENCIRSLMIAGLMGSSPLTRGKPVLGLRAHGDEGLIPAHAGKTGFEPTTVRLSAAHPRSRGENGQDGHDEGAPAGSSPLTRGKLPVLGREFARAGLIPAHAGKTIAGRGRSGRPQAHPRSRGENDCRARPIRSPAGSSPLTRGKRRWPG